MDKKTINSFYVSHSSQFFELDVQKETQVQDENLKQKLRSLNLIKYNPNLFVNKDSGFTDLIGGNKSIALILGMGSLFAIYRSRVNNFRQMSTREGIWMVNMYFVYGMAVGGFYSGVFFWKWQQHLNEIYSYYLLKRYNGSSDLSRKNIHQFKDIPNGDECYNYSNKFVNHAH